METPFSKLTGVVKSADRVLDLLELLGYAPRPLALAEVTHELGFPKSSTLTLLRTLAARGYVVRDGNDRYVLAHPFGKEEGDWLGGLPRQVVAFSRPVIDTLVGRTRETVNIGAMIAGFMIRPLVQVPSPQEIRYEPQRVDCPAFCTAMGRILLAYAPPDHLDLCLSLPLPCLTPLTETNPARLRALIAEARRLGHAVIEGEYAEGGTGVAAPVFDRNGRAVAALNLASLTERWGRHRESYIQAVKEAAASVTVRLGGRAPAQEG